MYSYATSLNGLADQEDLRLGFEVLIKSHGAGAMGRPWTPSAMGRPCARATSTKCRQSAQTVLYWAIQGAPRDVRGATSGEASARLPAFVRREFAAYPR